MVYYHYPKARLVSLMLYFLLAFTSAASALADRPPVHFLPDEQSKILSKRIISKLIHSHYLQFDVDQRLSEQVLNRYLNNLDSSHQFFLKKDIIRYSNSNAFFAKDIQEGRLNGAYLIADDIKHVKIHFYDYALMKVSNPMKLHNNDFIENNRSHAEWPENDASRKKLWDKIIIDEIIRIELAGHTRKDAQQILGKRYSKLKKHLTRQNDIFDNAMNSFVNVIDPHSRYLSSDSDEAFETEMTLNLSGIGVSLRQTEDYGTEITSVAKGGPAYRSGKISPGDILLSVSDTRNGLVKADDYLTDEVLKLIRGKKGSVVKLGLLTPSGRHKTVTLKRDSIELIEQRANVRTIRHQDKKIAILSIPSFYEGVANDVDKALFGLRENTDVVVINLINNGGGSLTEAVLLTNLFVGSGPVVQVQKGNSAKPEILGSQFSDNYKFPLVVIVNSGSASASEIFSAALQDYGLAVIVGERTFGKGTVQERHTLARIYDKKRHPDWSELGSLIYTTQKFYRVNGESTQIKGVIPDIFIPMGGDYTGERFENNALPWDKIDTAEYDHNNKIREILPLLTRNHVNRRLDNKLKCTKELHPDVRSKYEFQLLPLDISKRRELADKKNALLSIVMLRRIMLPMIQAEIKHSMVKY